MGTWIIASVSLTVLNGLVVIHKGKLLLANLTIVFFLLLAEDPSESYVKLRDFVLVKLCQDLPCFSPENLKQGFSQDMVIEAQQKLKVNKVLIVF